MDRRPLLCGAGGGGGVGRLATWKGSGPTPALELPRPAPTLLVPGPGGERCGAAPVCAPTCAQNVQGLERRLERASLASLVDEAQACRLCPMTLRCCPSAVAAPAHQPGRSGDWALWARRGEGDDRAPCPSPARGPSTHPAPGQCVSGAGGPAALHSVVEELVRFRQKVRQFALAAREAPGEAQQQLLERQPLLEACDTLRRDLAAHGISIKVSAALPPALPPPQRPLTRPISFSRTGAACPRGSCWTRGQKTPNQGAEATGCGGHGSRRGSVLLQITIKASCSRLCVVAQLTLNQTVTAPRVLVPHGCQRPTGASTCAGEWVSTATDAVQ